MQVVFDVKSHPLRTILIDLQRHDSTNKGTDETGCYVLGRSWANMYANTMLQVFTVSLLLQ
jgi:hypothetical protein